MFRTARFAALALILTGTLLGVVRASGNRTESASGATERLRKILDVGLRDAGQKALSGELDLALGAYVAAIRKAEEAVAEVHVLAEREAGAREIERFRRALRRRLKQASEDARQGKLRPALDALTELTRAAEQSLAAVLPDADRVGLQAGVPQGAAPPIAKRPGTFNVDGRPSVPSARHKAVENALRWLAAHQSPDGSWEAAGFGSWCDGKPITDRSKQPDGAGKARYDVGVTGLALCAFLSAGYTNRGKHAFASVIMRGLRYLLEMQDQDGCFGPRLTQQYVYNHATASLAVVEAFRMTGSAALKRPAQRCLDYIGRARNPYFAWRYGIKPGDNDTSVSGWMIRVVHSAQLVNRDAIKRGRPAPLSLDEGASRGMLAWLQKVTSSGYGRVGYVQRGTGSSRPQELADHFPGEKTEATTAIGILARILLGANPRRDNAIREGAGLCAKLPPVWNPSDGSIDMYYWYYGTLALFEVGGKHWRVWKGNLARAVVGTQHLDTDYCQYRGSWDPIGPWGVDGGRVYSTALMSMALSTYYKKRRP